MCSMCLQTEKLQNSLKLKLTMMAHQLVFVSSIFTAFCAKCESLASEAIELQLSEAFLIPLHQSFFEGSTINPHYIHSNSTLNFNSRLKENVRLWVQQHDYPDLPSWLRLKQCNNCEYAYLYGSPAKTGLFRLQFIVQLLSNSSWHVVPLRLQVHSRTDVACNHVQIKLLNVDVEDLLDSRLDALLDIFRKQLWPLEKISKTTSRNERIQRSFESTTHPSIYIKSKKFSANQWFLKTHSSIQHLASGQQSIYLSSILSTVDAGFRLPLDPTQKLGVVLRIGGVGQFSDHLLHLHRELQPVQQLRPCPTDYRSSSAEHLFRAKRFLVDWCHFDLIAGHCSKALNATTKTITSNAWNSSKWNLNLKSGQQKLIGLDQRQYQPLIALNLAVVSLLALVLLIILICASCN